TVALLRFLGRRFHPTITLHGAQQIFAFQSTQTAESHDLFDRPPTESGEEPFFCPLLSFSPNEAGELC
ncbi:MAG: hypothetical protein ACKV2Q_24660, partial [Planctomycetaceae bacterium]